MATNVSRKGFWPAKSQAAGEPTARKWVAGNALTAGDACILSQGYAGLALAASGSLLGVAANDAAIGADVYVYDDPATIFVGQCTTSYTTAMRGKIVDITGATGAMEIAQSTTSTSVVTILQEIISDDNIIGPEKAKVLFRITKHQLNGTQTA
jgi:hypothetical protein